MSELRKVLEGIVGHTQPCDCLLCRKDGKLDQAEVIIRAMIPKEKLNSSVSEYYSGFNDCRAQTKKNMGLTA